MDNHTAEQRRKNMQAIKSKNSKIETLLRKALWAKGYRYRVNYKKILGKPDIVFIGKKIAIFCDSEFWHGYNYDEIIERIGTNNQYWRKKIKRNMERDLEVNNTLKNEDWIVLRFWEKQILMQTDQCVEEIERVIKTGRG